MKGSRNNQKPGGPQKREGAKRGKNKLPQKVGWPRWVLELGESAIALRSFSCANRRMAHWEVMAFYYGYTWRFMGTYNLN